MSFPRVNISVDSTDLIEGVRPLREQIRSFRNGGLRTGSRELKDSDYDEDDSQVVDPSSEFGLDRFEKMEKITDQISERMAAAHRDKIEHAEV